MNATITDLILKTTAKWAKQRKAEIRSQNAQLRRNEALARRDRPATLKEAAFQVMPLAYRKASANGALPANARQIFYCARGPILEMTGRDSLDSNYFTQTLLPAYLEERNPGWEPAFDDRGHFLEPHTDLEIGLGTLSVRTYLADSHPPQVESAGLAAAKVATCGPEGRYAGVLFIEKEGFRSLFEAARIVEKFDLAIASSKGMSTTAARQLVDELCGGRRLPLYVLHDFDVSGFSILKTLTSPSRRYWFKHRIKTIVDLGLRLADVEELGLDSEQVFIGKNAAKIRRRLSINGASADEVIFLLAGERVELNAMPSDEFIAFVERKLIAAGARKVVPSASLLAETYGAFAHEAQLRQTVEAEIERLREVAVAPPADLETRVKQYLAEHPDETWEAAVRTFVDESDNRARRSAQ
jgi:hypothetical protein